MKHRRPTDRRSAVALLMSLLVSLAVLPAGMAAPGDPVVGAWATYQWTSSLSVEVPVLIQQPQASGPATWSVTRESVAPRPVFVTYSVLRGEAKSYVLQIVTRLAVNSPALSITQVTIDRASGKALQSVIRRPKGTIATPESGLRPFRQAGMSGTTEEVAVPAGRFSAVRAPYQGGTVWVSDQVPAVGLAKATFPNGQLELLRSGTSGAQDLLRS